MKWKEFRASLADQIWSIPFHDALIVEIVLADAKYVQFVNMGEWLHGETGGPDTGLPSSVLDEVEALGWVAPPGGFGEIRNFRLVWDSAGEMEPADSFLSRADAEHAAKLTVKTLRGPLRADSPADVRIRKVADAYG